jgi:hypothetical protein
MPVSISEKAKLYKSALGLCSMPNCRLDLQYYTNDPKFGAEAAHIVAESPDGPRGDSLLSMIERNRCGNLLLLCPTHHTEIDALIEKYPVDRLKEIKKNHEAWTRQIRALGEPWSMRFLTVDYLNVPRLLCMPGGSQLQMELDRAGRSHLGSLRGLGMEIGSIVAAAKPVLRAWSGTAIDLSNLELDGSEGLPISFHARAYTKNCPSPTGPFAYTGDVEKDPHIWFRLGERKVFVRLDPAWITVTTAFVNFRSGNGTFAGLGIVMSVQPRRLIISPLVVGKPMKKEVAWLYEQSW